MGIDRRGFLAGMLALGAAPAIVRAGSMMPINQSRWTVGERMIVPRKMIYTFDSIWEPGPTVIRTITGSGDAREGDLLRITMGMPPRDFIVTKVTGCTFTLS